MHRLLPAARNVSTRSLSYLPPHRVKNNRLSTRDPRPTPAPKALRIAESEAMGKFDFAHLGQTKPRTVPTSAMEYAINRNAYHAQVGALRMQFKQEWAARKQREAVAAAQVRRKVEEEKRKRAEAKLEVKAAKRIIHEKQMALEAAKRSALQAVRREKRAAYFEKAEKKRLQWLQDLNADAEKWIGEKEIDTKITAETFAMDRPWQFDKYNEYKTASRADAVPGEVEFEDSWQSDLEDVDLWAPLDRQSRTGLQLNELFAQKRTPEILEELRLWQEDYIARNNLDPVLAEMMRNAKTEEEMEAVLPHSSRNLNEWGGGDSDGGEDPRVSKTGKPLGKGKPRRAPVVEVDEVGGDDITVLAAQMAKAEGEDVDVDDVKAVKK